MDLDGGVTTKNFKFKSDVGFYGEQYGYIPNLAGGLEPEDVFISGYIIYTILGFDYSHTTNHSKSKADIGFDSSQIENAGYLIESFDLTIGKNKINFKGVHSLSNDSDATADIEFNMFKDTFMTNKIGVFQDVEVNNVIIKKL